MRLRLLLNPAAPQSQARPRGQPWEGGEIQKDPWDPGMQKGIVKLLAHIPTLLPEGGAVQTPPGWEESPCCSSSSHSHSLGSQLPAYLE